MRPISVMPWRLSQAATVLLLVPFNLLAALGMDMYLPVVPRMADVLRVDAATVQVTLTVYLVVLGAGQLVFGPLSDRWGRRPVLVTGALFFAVASFGLATATLATEFLVWRLAQACGAAACMVVVFATVRDLYGGRPEGSAVYGLLGALLAVMPAVGPLFGALLDEWLGWRAIFAALGIGMSVMLLAALHQWRETHNPGGARVRSTQMLQPLRSLRFWWYVVGYGAGMGAFFVWFSTSPWLMMERMQLSQLAFSALFATVATTMIIASRTIGRFALRWGMRRSLQKGMACLFVAGVLLLIGECLAPDMLLSALAPMWIAGFGIAIANAVAPNAAMRDFDATAGTATAWFFCLGGAFAGITGTLATSVLPMHTRWPLAAYCLTASLLVLVSSKMTRLRALG